MTAKVMTQGGERMRGERGGRRSALGEWLEEMRARKFDGLTQDELARMIGCPTRTYMRWVAGSARPSPAYWNKIEAVCGTVPIMVYMETMRDPSWAAPAALLKTGDSRVYSEYRRRPVPARAQNRRSAAQSGLAPVLAFRRPA